MTENKRFILTEQFVTLQGITFVKDDNAYVDTYYTVGEAVDLLNDYAYDNKQLIKENCEYKRFASKDQDLLAEFHTEIEQLKKENGKLKKSINEYAFISDCSVQVLNEEEDVKEDYLALSCKELHKLKEENEQLKTQIKIFEKFLDENNLDIDWELFCTVDECKKDSDDYGCKECKYLGVMWND